MTTKTMKRLSRGSLLLSGLWVVLTQVGCAYPVPVQQAAAMPPPAVVYAPPVYSAPVFRPVIGWGYGHRGFGHRGYWHR